MTDSERSTAGPIVIETPAQAGILLNLLDDLAVVLELAAQTPTASGGRRAYASQLADEVRDVRAQLCSPGAEPPSLRTGFGAREWRVALCAALDQAPLQQAGLALHHREARGDTGPR